MKQVYSVLILFFYLSADAQNSYQFGLLPSINVNKDLVNDWKLNFKVESRQLFKEGIFKEESDFNYEYMQTDYSIIVSQKVGGNKSVYAGYLMRIQDNKIISRSIQQYVIAKQYGFFRMSHRFSADQTFQKSVDTEYRLRYRLSSEFPLRGQSVDPGEFYFKINNEYLNSFQSKDYDLGIRLTPFLGYEFTDSNKLEYGLEYRVNSFIDNGSDTDLWIGINWFLVF